MEGESRHERIYTGIRSPVYAHVGYAGRLGSVVDPVPAAACHGGGGDAAAGPHALWSVGQAWTTIRARETGTANLAGCR